MFTGGKPVSAATAVKGELFVDRTFRRQDGKNERLVSSLELLRQQAVKYTLAEYAQKCGVPVERMTEIAREFTHHGRRVVAVSNTGNNRAADEMCVLRAVTTVRAVPFTVTGSLRALKARMIWQLLRGLPIRTAR